MSFFFDYIKPSSCDLFHEAKAQNISISQVEFFTEKIIL